MSIFSKSSPADVKQAVATAPSEKGAKGGKPEQARLTPPFVPQAAAPRAAAAPGVVPPPKAPTVSMRPAEAAVRPYDIHRMLADSPAPEEGDGLANEDLRTAKEAQMSVRGGPVTVQGGVRVSTERTRMAAPRSAARGQMHQAATARVAQPRHMFDPVAAAQAGLLNLAWRWQEAGSPIRAIHTYMELLARYPGSPAASAAVADLVELSNKLAEQGNFHTALSIYDEMEHLDRMREEE